MFEICSANIGKVESVAWPFYSLVVSGVARISSPYEEVVHGMFETLPRFWPSIGADETRIARISSRVNDLNIFTGGDLS